jgi:hypothetical protein
MIKKRKKKTGTSIKPIRVSVVCEGLYSTSIFLET